MPNYTITIAADDIDELHQRMQDLLPQAAASVSQTVAAIPPANMSLQELLLYTDQRCAEAGYEMEVKRPQATTRKEEARAKLRGDLEDSIKEKTSTPAEDAQPDVVPAKKASKKNGKSDADLKAKAIKELQQLYADGRKSEVNKILAEFGDGAKNFNVIPEDQFGPILAAIEAL